jgi:hypothetical protein
LVSNLIDLMRMRLRTLQNQRHGLMLPDSIGIAKVGDAGSGNLHRFAPPKLNSVEPLGRTRKTVMLL